MRTKAAIYRRLNLLLLAILLLTSAACGAGGLAGSTGDVDATVKQADVSHAGAAPSMRNRNVNENVERDEVPIAMPRPLSLQTTIIRWAAWMILLTGIGLVLIALLFVRGRRRLLLAGLLALFLITCVPPFSYVPDPLGIALATTGRYRYDPRLPLINRFLVAGDPTQALRPSLDGLVGLTGREPLDPISPLDRYEFQSVTIHTYPSPAAIVRVRFIFENGTQHAYDIALAAPDLPAGFYACCWQYEGPVRNVVTGRRQP